MVFALVFGWLSDKVKSWKILVFLNILTILFGLGILIDVLANSEKMDEIS